MNFSHQVHHNVQIFTLNSSNKYIVQGHSVEVDDATKCRVSCRKWLLERLEGLQCDDSMCFYKQANGNCAQWGGEGRGLFHLDFVLFLLLITEAEHASSVIPFSENVPVQN